MSEWNATERERISVTPLLTVVFLFLSLRNPHSVNSTCTFENLINFSHMDRPRAIISSKYNWIPLYLGTSLVLSVDEDDVFA